MTREAARISFLLPTALACLGVGCGIERYNAWDPGDDHITCGVGETFELNVPGGWLEPSIEDESILSIADEIPWLDPQPRFRRDDFGKLHVSFREGSYYVLSCDAPGVTTLSAHAGPGVGLQFASTVLVRD